MIFLAIVALLMMRSCMSMTLTQMVEPNTKIVTDHQDPSACPVPNIEKDLNTTVSTVAVGFSDIRNLEAPISKSFRL